MIGTLLSRLRRKQPTAPSIEHTVCCDQNTALCGLDVTDEPWTRDAPGQRECPGCAAAAGVPCPRCGDAL